MKYFAALTVIVALAIGVSLGCGKKPQDAGPGKTGALETKCGEVMKKACGAGGQGGGGGGKGGCGGQASGKGGGGR